MQREIRLFRSWNTLPHTKNLKPKFEFQTSLAQNAPAGTSELIPFGTNSDLCWDWKSREIILRDSSLLSPVGFYYASPLVRNYISPLCLYYASTFVGNYTNHQKYKIYYFSLHPFPDYVYIVDLNNRLHVGWKTLPNLNYKPKFKT